MHTIPKIQSSHAVLVVHGDYVLQLRDDKPTIAAAGQWSLFGGMINANETPMEAIQREIQEELSVGPNEFRYLWFTDYYSEFEKSMIRTWFFVSDISLVWEKHRLTEGQKVGVFPIEKIKGLNMPVVMKETIKRFHRQVAG